MTHLFVYRLRNASDLEAGIEEISGVYDKKTLHQLYSIATDKPHSFVYIDLMAREKTKMFYERSEKRLIPR